MPSSPEPSRTSDTGSGTVVVDDGGIASVCEDEKAEGPVLLVEIVRLVGVGVVSFRLLSIVLPSKKRLNEVVVLAALVYVIVCTLETEKL